MSGIHTRGDSLGSVEFDDSQYEELASGTSSLKLFSDRDRGVFRVQAFRDRVADRVFGRLSVEVNGRCVLAIEGADADVVESLGIIAKTIGGLIKNGTLEKS